MTRTIANPTIATHNLSAGAVKNRPEKVKADLIDALSRFDVILIQEAGADTKILHEVVRTTGARLYLGNGRAGQASTPILVAKGIKVRFEAHEVSPRGLFVGRGAGPSRAKAKHLMVAVITTTDGVQWAIGNLHGIASPQFALRGRLQRRMYRRAARIMKRRYKKMRRVIGGDLNAPPGRPTRIPFWRIAKLRSTQRILGLLPTHGPRRVLDDIVIDRKIRALSHGVEDTPSDHRRYWVRLSLKKRKRD